MCQFRLNGGEGGALWILTELRLVALLTLSPPASPQPPSVCVPLSIWCISLPFCWCTSTSLCWFGDHFFRLPFCCIYFTLPHASLHGPPKNLFSHPNIWFCSQPWSKLVNGPNTNKVEEQKIWEYWKRNRNSLYTIKQFMSGGFKLVCDSWHHSTLSKATSLSPLPLMPHVSQLRTTGPQHYVVKHSRAFGCVTMSMFWPARTNIADDTMQILEAKTVVSTHFKCQTAICVGWKEEWLGTRALIYHQPCQIMNL